MRPVTKFLHLRLGLTPNQVSVIGFAVGLVAVVPILLEEIEIGLLLLALSQIVDGIDGSIARVFNLRSRLGGRLETIFDRLNEFFLFLALAIVGEVTYTIFILAYAAILLVTSVKNRSDFDPGFKRIVLYFGYFLGFQFVLTLAFAANLLGFVASLLLLDFTFQKEVDQAIGASTGSGRRREELLSRGRSA
ncbi:MAG: CDP-alcohol phosphatidyltransferase family protein [Bacteroidota bacterium]